MNQQTLCSHASVEALAPLDRHNAAEHGTHLSGDDLYVERNRGYQVTVSTQRTGNRFLHPHAQVSKSLEIIDIPEIECTQVLDR